MHGTDRPRGADRPGRGATRRLGIDPRLVIGVVLVAASAVGVFALVSAADASETLYSARVTLTAGDRIDEDDLLATSVRDGAGGGLYLAPGDIPPEGLVVTRTVGEGELVPMTALGSTTGVRLTSIVLSVDGQLPATVVAGSVVDVWVASEDDDGVIGAPEVIVSGATVVRLVESETIVAGRQTTAVELLVPRDRVARVLEALAGEASVSIVPADLPARPLTWRGSRSPSSRNSSPRSRSRRCATGTTSWPAPRVRGSWSGASRRCAPMRRSWRRARER